MRLAARVDRLDLGTDVAVIVDYKSGRYIPRSDLVQGRRLQLQLYAHLARAHAERVVARYGWLSPNAREWDLDTAREEDARLIDNAVALAGEVRRAASQGDFRVRPEVPTCPSYCAFIHACRVNELSRWKRWG
jgi:RecB family exonuclease